MIGILPITPAAVPNNPVSIVSIYRINDIVLFCIPTAMCNSQLTHSFSNHHDDGSKYTKSNNHVKNHFHKQFLRPDHLQSFEPVQVEVHPMILSLGVPECFFEDNAWLQVNLDDDSTITIMDVALFCGSK